MRHGVTKSIFVIGVDDDYGNLVLVDAGFCFKTKAAALKFIHEDYDTEQWDMYTVRELIIEGEA